MQKVIYKMVKMCQNCYIGDAMFIASHPEQE